MALYASASVWSWKCFDRVLTARLHPRTSQPSWQHGQFAERLESLAMYLDGALVLVRHELFAALDRFRPADDILEIASRNGIVDDSTAASRISRHRARRLLRDAPAGGRQKINRDRHVRTRRSEHLSLRHRVRYRSIATSRQLWSSTCERPDPTIREGKGNDTRSG
jgi:hypothetical protein